MITKEQQIERHQRCLQYLKDIGVESHHHYSYYAEGGEYEEGGPDHTFWDESGNRYRFLFDTKGDFKLILI